MTVRFVGAGPGAADLLTLRAAALLGEADVVLYPGTYLDEAVLSHCRDTARLVDTQGLDLDTIVAHLVAADGAGEDVVRLVSGDPSLYSAVASCSSGVELDQAQVVVVGNARGVGGRYRIGHSVMRDALDADGIWSAIKDAGLDLPERRVLRRNGLLHRGLVRRRRLGPGVGLLLRLPAFATGSTLVSAPPATSATSPAPYDACTARGARRGSSLPTSGRGPSTSRPGGRPGVRARTTGPPLRVP